LAEGQTAIVVGETGLGVWGQGHPGGRGKRGGRKTRRGGLFPRTRVGADPKSLV